MAYGYQSGYNPQRNGEFWGELPESLEQVGAWHRPGFSKGAPVYVGNSEKDGSGTDLVFTVEGVEGIVVPDGSSIVCYDTAGVLQWRTKLPAGGPLSHSWLLALYYPTNVGLLLCRRFDQLNQSSNLVALDALTGALVWNSTLQVDQFFTLDQPVIDSEGDIYVFTRQANPSATVGMTKIDGETGQSLWLIDAHISGSLWHNSSWVNATLSPAEDFLYMAWDGAVTTVDPATGDILFQTESFWGATNVQTWMTCDSKFLWVKSLQTNHGNTYLRCFILNADGSVTPVLSGAPRSGEKAWTFPRAIPTQYGVHAATNQEESNFTQDLFVLVDDQSNELLRVKLPYLQEGGTGVWTEVLFDSNARMLYVNRAVNGSMHCLSYLPQGVADAWNKLQEDEGLRVTAAGTIFWSLPLPNSEYTQPWLDPNGILYVNANGGLLAYGAEAWSGGRKPADVTPPADGGYLATGAEVIVLTAPPTANTAAGTWSDSVEAYTADEVIASTEVEDDIEEFVTATALDALPATATIYSVAVVLVGAKDITGGDGDLYYSVELSWDGGATWTSPAKSADLTEDLTELVVGGPQFERAWTVTELGSPLFQMRITAKGTAIVDIPAWTLDSIAARVTYSV